MNEINIIVYPRMTLFGKRWFFRLRGVNHEILAQSEAYTRKASAEHTANLIANGNFQVVVVEQ